VKFIARFNKVDRNYRVTRQKNTGCESSGYWKSPSRHKAAAIGNGTKLEIIKGQITPLEFQRKEPQKGTGRIKIKLSVITCMNLDMVLSLRLITPACLLPNSHIAEIQCFKKSFNPPWR
jgi:hypothetical protein